MASTGAYSSSHNYAADQQTPTEYARINLPKSLRIAWIHPDLGIGGAERLVVDAAVSLQKRGHQVEIFTSHHEDGPTGRSFEETRDGTLKVHVLGASIFPSSLGGQLKIVFAILRQVHLTISFILACFLYHLYSLPLIGHIFRAFIQPIETPFKSSSDWSITRQVAPFDVIIVDQLSATIPLLRWLGANRVVFYCHFPDQLLSPSRNLSYDPRLSVPFSLKGALRAFYRAPIDQLEEASTGEADKILVNSEFTSQVFQKTFPEMNRIPRVVYPGIDTEGYGKEVVAAPGDKWLVSGEPTLLSVNRFEGKKDVALAIDAFARARSDHPKLRLVIAGGYDPRQADNVITLSNLVRLADSHKLSSYVFSNSSNTTTAPSRSSITIHTTPPTGSPQILFLLNMTNSQKSLLFSSTTTIALLYTPSFEHFGIVPLEAGASGLPVIATNSGGPTETIIDAGLTGEGSETTTGLLRIPSAELWSEAIKDLVTLSSARRAEMGIESKKRVQENFSLEKLGKELELACVDAAGVGEPIMSEIGFIKLLIFMGLGSFVFLCGVFAFSLRFMY